MEEAGLGSAVVGSGVDRGVDPGVPAGAVEEVIEASGRMQQSHRALPARAMAYFAIAMGLYSDGSYEDVLTQLTDGLSWASG